MPSYPDPEKCGSITFHAKDEVKREKIKGFKIVCLRDNLEQQDEFYKMVDKWLREHHYPPGNPQTQLFHEPPKKKPVQPEWQYNKELMSLVRVGKRDQ